MMSYSWEDKHFFRFILDEVLAVNNKRNQLKIKGFTAQNNQWQVLGVLKPKYINRG